MNNLLSYCGLVDVRINASDKDLPVAVGVDGSLAFSEMTRPAKIKGAVAHRFNSPEFKAMSNR